MIYSEKFDRYIDNDLVVYRYVRRYDKLIQCKPRVRSDGRRDLRTKAGKMLYHRLIWEMIKGPIPPGYQIDHIDTDPSNNKLENLRLCSQTENMNNPLTRRHLKESHKGIVRIRDFGDRFKEHFGISMKDNRSLYKNEWRWYISHNRTCRWEVENADT